MKKLAVFLALSTAVLMASCARPAASSAPEAKIQASSVAISSSSSTASTGPAISVATSTSGDATTLISYQIVFKIQNLSSQSINGFVIRATSLGDCAVEDQNPNSLPLDNNYAGYQWDCSSVIQPNATEQVSIMVIPKQARTQDITFSFFDKGGKSALVNKDGNPVAAVVKFNVTNGSGNQGSSSSESKITSSSASPSTDDIEFSGNCQLDPTNEKLYQYIILMNESLEKSYKGIVIIIPKSCFNGLTPVTNLNNGVLEENKANYRWTFTQDIDANEESTFTLPLLYKGNPPTSLTMNAQIYFTDNPSKVWHLIFKSNPQIQ